MTEEDATIHSVDFVLSLPKAVFGAYSVEEKSIIIALRYGRKERAYALVTSAFDSRLNVFDSPIKVPTLSAAFEDLRETDMPLNTALQAAADYAIRYLFWPVILVTSLGLIWEPAFEYFILPYYDTQRTGMLSEIYPIVQERLALVAPYISTFTVIYALRFSRLFTKSALRPADFLSKFCRDWASWPQWKRRASFRSYWLDVERIVLSTIVSLIIAVAMSSPFRNHRYWVDVTEKKRHWELYWTRFAIYYMMILSWGSSKLIEFALSRKKDRG